MDNSEQRNNAPNLKTVFFEEVAEMLESSKTPKWKDPSCKMLDEAPGMRARPPNERPNARE